MMILKTVLLGIILFFYNAFACALQKNELHFNAEALEKELGDFDEQNIWNFPAFYNNLACDEYKKAYETINLIISVSKKYIFGYIKLIENAKNEGKMIHYLAHLKRISGKIILHFNILVDLDPSFQQIPFLIDLSLKIKYFSGFLDKRKRILLEKDTVCFFQEYCLRIQSVNFLFFKYAINFNVLKIQYYIDLFELNYNRLLENVIEKSLIEVKQDIIMLNNGDDDLEYWLNFLSDKYNEIKREKNEAGTQKLPPLQEL